MRVLVTLAALAALLVAGAAGAAGAASFSVRSFIEPASGITDTDPFRLVVRIDGSELPDVQLPRLPTLTNVHVVNGPSTSDQLSWVNGQSSASRTLIWTLLAEKPGPAEIPPLDLRVGASVYRTAAIAFEVRKGTTGPRTGPPGLPGGARRPGGARDASGEPDVFLEAKLGEDEVWVGQPVPLTVTLYSAVDVTNLAWREIPAFSGFWTEDVPVDPNAERARTTVEGRPYMAYPLERKILMPTAAGDRAIESYAAQFQVRRTTGDVFNDFFAMRRVQDVIRKTEPLTLRVKRLPDAGRPPDFSGAVGTFRMSASVDRKEAQVNDALAVKLTVSGDGFLKSATAPKLDAPPDLKVFEPKVTESTSTAGGKVSSKKTWEWVVVPLVPGETRIAAPSFSYFDPSSGTYRSLSSEPLLVAIRKSDRPQEAPLARGDVRPSREEIEAIKTLEGKLRDDRVAAHRRPWFLAAFVAPLLWVPAWIALGRRRMRLQQDRGFARAGRARTHARRRLKVAERHMGSDDAVSFHEDVARALVEYVADRFDRPPAGLTYESADALLESAGIDAALRTRFRTCLERCDFARFVPDSARDAAKTDVLKDANDLVDAIERAL